MAPHVSSRRTGGVFVALSLAAGLYAAPAIAEPDSTDTTDSGSRASAAGSPTDSTSPTTNQVGTLRSGVPDTGTLDIDTVMEQAQNERVSSLDQQIEGEMQDILNKQALIRQSQDPDEIDQLQSDLQLDMLRIQSLSSKRNQAIDLFSKSAYDFERIVGRL